MTTSATISATQSNVPTSTKQSVAARGILRAIQAYQFLRQGRIAPCRFHPSCSEYAVEALETHGAVKGGWLAVRRISRCRPLGPHGIDLVPLPKKARSHQ